MNFRRIFSKSFSMLPVDARAWKLLDLMTNADFPEIQRSLCPLVSGANHTMIIPTR